MVGLNFDFISLNIVGFLLYSVFNCGLYFIPTIKVILNYLFILKYFDHFTHLHNNFGTPAVIIEKIIFSKLSFFRMYIATKNNSKALQSFSHKFSFKILYIANCEFFLIILSKTNIQLKLSWDPLYG